MNSGNSALDRGSRHLISQQRESGCWEGEMIWCPVVTAQVAITRRVVGRPFSVAEAQRIVLYFGRMQNPAGAFGLHPEHPGSVFVTMARKSGNPACSAATTERCSCPTTARRAPLSDRK